MKLMLIKIVWLILSLQVNLTITKLFQLDFKLDFKHDFKHYEIIPSSLIDSILLDPRISKRYEDLYRAAINSMGYENEVKKSRLYEFEKLTITVS